MPKDRKECGIKIRKNGPYVVTGNVPFSEKTIVPKGRGYELRDGRELPQAEEWHYAAAENQGTNPFVMPLMF